MSETEGLALRTTVNQLVAAWREVEQTIRAAFFEIAAAEERLNAAFTMGGNREMRVRGRWGANIDFARPDDSLIAMARTCWSHIVDRLELRRVLSEAKWRELQRTLDKGDLPEITEENVMRFAELYMQTLPELFAEKVTESFEWIRPRERTARAELKTNEKNAFYEIGPKVILGYVVEAGCYGKLHVRYGGAQQHLSALESVFRALDGQGYRTAAHYSDLETAINASEDGTAETAYFEARAFKNGNLHLIFRRLDLLAQFNRIAGGQRLKAAS